MLDGGAFDLAVTDAQQRVGQQKSCVVALRRRHGHGHAFAVLARETRQKSGAALVARLGDEGLRHQCAFGRIASALNEERERQGPGTHLRHFPAQVLAAIGNHGILFAHGVAENHIGAGIACGLELLAQVGHAQRKTRYMHRLEFARLQCRLYVLETRLAIAGGVGKNGHPGPAALDEVVHDKRRLDDVARRGAEDVAVGAGELGGQRCSGGAGNDERDAGRLEHVQRLHRHAGIAKPEGGYNALRGQLL